MSSSNRKDLSSFTKGIPAQELPVDESVGSLEPIAFFNDAMPTGVTVSHSGRIFINFPKWGDDVKFTVAEIQEEGRMVAYPNELLNKANENDLASAFVSVQSVVVDPVDRLWILDTGSPLFKPTEYGGPKLVCVDLNTNNVTKKILFPQAVALPTTYLNDVRFDLRRGQEGMAFITDSSQNGPNGIIVVDLASGERLASTARSSINYTRRIANISSDRRRAAILTAATRWFYKTWSWHGCRWNCN